MKVHVPYDFSVTNIARPFNELSFSGEIDQRLKLTSTNIRPAR